MHAGERLRRKPRGGMSWPPDAKIAFSRKRMYNDKANKRSHSSFNNIGSFLEAL